VSPVAFLASKFPGKSDQEYRQHLGSFGITGLTGYVCLLVFVLRSLSPNKYESMQVIATLSGGQKSRVAFAALSLQNPHVLLLDEVSLYIRLADVYVANRLTSFSRPIISILR
jgi:ATP-binding cassette subfamily F protein 3